MPEPTIDDALALHAALQAAYGELLLLLVEDDPEPHALAALDTRIGGLAAQVETIQRPTHRRDELLAAMAETVRLSDAAAAAARERRDALTADQAGQQQRSGAMSAYQPPGAAGDARFVDRRG